MNQFFTNGRHAIRLDDGTVIADPSYHCLCPFLTNGFLLLALCGPNNKIRALKLATGQKFDFQPMQNVGGAIEWASDGRYVIGVQRISLEKQYKVLDLRGVIFDTLTETWRGPLVIKTKPGQVGVPTFPRPNVIRFTDNLVPKERTIDLATGTMGPIINA